MTGNRATADVPIVRTTTIGVAISCAALIRSPTSVPAGRLARAAMIDPVAVRPGARGSIETAATRTKLTAGKRCDVSSNGRAETPLMASATHVVIAP
jgi:hypothetical protein